MNPALPVDDIRADVLGHWRDRGCLVQSPPGSGKTTRLPLWLLDETAAEIVLLLPRRLPVRLAARRLAEQLGETVGETVGYSLRHDTRRGPGTRLTVTSYGAFLRRLQQDPSLSGVDTVILDEFHERRLDQDTCLTLLHSCRELFREDLKLLLMSATLTIDTLQRALDLPRVESRGEQYPLSVHYRPARDEPWPAAATRVIEEARTRTTGHLLVFLPGLKEIETLRSALPDEIPSLIVHSQARQDNLSQQLETPTPTVILSTNIAESSVTLPGVRGVVDLGLERYPVVNPVTDLTALRTRAISKSSARQRAGRAARLGPGDCYRLWSQAQQDGLAPDPPPEITQTDLKSLVLTLSVWGQGPEEAFWLTPPSPGRWRAAVEQLTHWGAFDRHGKLTGHGRQLESLGLDPALAQLVLTARERHCLEDAVWFAALQRLERPLPEPPEHGLTLAVRQADAPLRREAAHLARRLGVHLPKTARPLPHAVLVRAWPHRLIRLKSPGSDQGLLGTGQAVRLDFPPSGQRWCLLLTGREGKRWVRARQILPLTEASVEDELPAASRVRFSPDRGTGQFVEQRWRGPFLVSEQPTRPDKEVRDRAWSDWLARTPILDWPGSERSHDWLRRYTLLRQHWPQWPEPPGSRQLADVAGPYLAGIKRLADLDTVAIMEAWLGYDAARRFQQACPTHWQAPSGRRCRLDYQPEQERVAASLKLQEAFGLTHTPSVASGRQSITLDLLAPNGRVLARVSDLPYFWQSIYPEVRKEMRGRYNKHPWPEDPLTAPASQATNRQLGMTNGQEQRNP